MFSILKIYKKLIQKHVFSTFPNFLFRLTTFSNYGSWISGVLQYMLYLEIKLCN